VSLNTFVQQALQGAVHGKGRGGRGKDWGRYGWNEWAQEHKGGQSSSSSRVHGWYEG
jgi:hypothetical protein